MQRTMSTHRPPLGALARAVLVSGFGLVLCACGRSGDADRPPEVAPSPGEVVPTPMPPGLEAEAEGLLRAGDLEGLIDLLEPIEAASMSPRVALILASALHKAQRHGAALPYFERALSAEPPVPGYAGGLHLQAWCLFQLGRLEESRELFERHAELVPDEGDTFIGLGRIALSEGRLDDAKSLLGRAAELHRTAAARGLDRRAGHGRALAWLGDVELARGELGAARAALEASVVVHPESPGAWGKLADVRAAQGDESGAEDARRRRDALGERTAPR